MPLHVTLTDNTLDTGLPLRPRVVNREAVAFETILQFMAMDTALEEADMGLAVNRLRAAMLFYMGMGYKVETPIGHFAAHVKGKRNGSDTTPEISRDNTIIRYRVDRELNEEIRNRITIELEEQVDPKRPRISCLENVEDSGCVDQCSPNQIIHLVGSRLSFDHEAEDEGVFFVGEDQSAHRATVYSRHGSNIVDCKVRTPSP